jgi:hypothetical protein
MMTDPTAARSDDPNWLVAQLRADIDAADIDADLPEDPTPEELWALQLLARPDVEYSAVLEAAVDALIQPVKISPAARQRFIAAAERALAVRRAELGPLPVVLAAARKRAGRSQDDVQAELDQAEVEFTGNDLETGRVSVRRAGVKVTAIWIHAVGAERLHAREAARRSLDADMGGEIRPAAGHWAIPNDTEEWLAELDAALDDLERGSRD